MAGAGSNDPAAAALAELPPAVVRTDAEELAPHLVGWRGQKRGAALALLLPHDVAEVQDIVRWAGRHRIAIVPQGGNTGLVGGGIPEPAGPRAAVVLSLRRLNRIEAVDVPGLSLVVGAGAILDHVHAAAAQAGCRFPLSLAARGSATIGGLVSTNAGGVQVLRHGPMRSLVLGLEAVLADGTILNQLSALRKDNSGYDIKQLLIGAEGTLGVVTRVALKLAPPLGETATAWAVLASADAALALLHRLRAGCGERIESFELLSPEALATVAEQLPDVRLPCAAPAAFQVLIEAEVPPAMLQQLLMQAMDAGEVVDAVFAASGREAAALWAVRENVPVAEHSQGPAIKNDIAVPVEQVTAFHAAATRLFADALPAARPIVFGHLGDGNLHWNLRPPAGVDAAPWLRAHEARARHMLHDLVVRFGGSISAEHGIGTLKAAELARLGDPGKLAAMRAVKRALDPENIFNPGKIFA